MQEPRWTLDELAERVDTALAVDYHGQPSGRVRAVPDRRAIRWYTTIGLIDRPAAHRGRTALYGPRHLLQLVAVKRLQAKGLPLVAIQRELAGATDTELARVARLAEGARPRCSPGPSGCRRPAAATRRGRWRTDGCGAPTLGAPAQPPAVAPRVAGGTARRASFWRDRPPRPPPRRPPMPPPAADPPGPVSAAPATLQGVRLGAGATLLLEPGRELAAADLDAILDAAGPLLAVLRDRGLVAGARARTTRTRPGPGPAPGPARRPRSLVPRGRRRTNPEGSTHDLLPAAADR